MRHPPSRILMLNSERGWRGGENQVLLLAKGLAGGDPAQLSVLSVCQPDSPLAQAMADSGLDVTRIEMRGQLDVRAIRSIRTLLHQHQITVVHAHSSHAHSLAALACLGTGIPLVVTRRVDFPLKRGWFSRWKYVKAVKRYAAVSAGVQQVLMEGGVDAKAIDVIHDGIDFARFAPSHNTPNAPTAHSPLRQELDLPADALVIGIVAHLTDHKDHRTLLQAFARIEPRCPQAWLVVVGSGELDETLKQLAHQLGLQRVRFLGARTDVPMIMRGLDIFTLCSHLEGLGSSLMDAMYCALPVVATRAGGIPELITHQEDGLLVGIRDPAALAEALIRLLEDADLRRRLGSAAALTAQRRFSAVRMVAAYQEFYRRIDTP